jgi:16S rRNA (guanine527-N7)-methyltransferase
LTSSIAAQFGPEAFARELNVSRETLERLEAFVALLVDWNSRHNLVSARSLQDVWRRHILDSAQLTRFLPTNANHLIDLGSGAGFPGIILAALRPGLSVTLVEATAKKCRFLAEADACLSTRVRILNCRIEDVPRTPFDVVTARACAPLPGLAAHAQRFVGSNTVCLFLKGQNVGGELTEARNSWRMKVQSHASLSDPAGTVLEIHRLAPL